MTDSVPYTGWLGDAITSVQPDHVALVFIEDINPASIAEDQLKTNGVIMNHVRHRATVRNSYMTGNDGAAKAAGDQVTIMHAGATNDPRRFIAQSAYAELMFNLRVLDLRAERNHFDFCAIGRYQQALPVGKILWMVRQDAQFAR